ncbi:MAG TPA: hypothetical protein P5056_03080 [Candidatus Paceibacterota bacterium]|nr:hypothetical protein [Candidatus Paceibacterota bacterium]
MYDKTMGERGPLPKEKIKIRWSRNFAYAIGLISSDGSLSKNGRHISFVSKDKDQVLNFIKALHLKNIKIGKNYSGQYKSLSYRVQFGSVFFYNFLLSLGLTPNKSKSIGKLNIPDKFFFDFLRGVFDGDGSTYSYWDKRWRSSFMFYTEFASASEDHIFWLRNKIYEKLAISGHVTRDGKGSTLQLKYAKAESVVLLKKMFGPGRYLFLKRKRLKINKMLCIVGEKV